MRLFIVGIVLLFAPFITCAEALNAGFVEGVWFGNDRVFADIPVRIYTAIRNNTGSDITGSVEFFDNKERIGRRTISAIDGHIIEGWTDWTPTYGNHTISAKLTRIEIHMVGADTKEIEVVSANAETTLFVDYDTDGDGLGNREDTDDDNDEILDEEELKNGTDPLVYTKQEPEEDEKEESSTHNSKEREEDTSRHILDEPSQGLEQYLTESPARTAFSSMTNVIHTAKEKVDTYRASRNEKKDIDNEVEKNTTDSTTTSTFDITQENRTGFGTVTRMHATSSGSGAFAFIRTIVNLIGSLLGALYTFVLFILSVVLGHPILVQIVALSLFLLLLFFLVRKIGRRPSH